MQNGQILGGGGGVIKSIQRGTIVIAGSAVTNTATIASVSSSDSEVVMDGNTSQHLSDATTGTGWAGLTLTNATTVTATRTTGTAGETCTVSYEVIEYYPGVLKSVQRGTKTFIGAAAATQTITSVVTTLSVHSRMGLTGDTNLYQSQFEPYSVLTNATTLTFTSSYTGGAISYTAYWQVKEFNA